MSARAVPRLVLSSVRVSVLLAALLVGPTARAAEPAPDRITWKAGGDDRTVAFRKAGTALEATGGILIAAAAVTGLVSAATVGPCSGNGSCGEEGVLGRVIAPALAGSGAGIALTGVALTVLAGRGGHAALVVPALRRDGGAIVVLGVF